MMTVDGDVNYVCIAGCAFTGELVLDSCSFTVRGAYAQNSCHSAFAAGENIVVL